MDYSNSPIILPNLKILVNDTHSSNSFESKISIEPDVEEIVELNVGGTYFSTLRSTLTSIPDSMLSSMFSGRWSIRKDKNGHCFIDRDPNLFKLVLNGLRNGCKWFEPSDPNNREGLDIELDYFSLKMLIEKYGRGEIYNRIYYVLCGIKNEIGYLDLNNNEWKLVHTISSKLCFDECAVVACFGKFFIMGGNSIFPANKQVRYLDVANNKWSFAKSMINPRLGHAAVSLNGIVYVLGGRNDYGILDSVECYDFKKNNWENNISMQERRSGLAATVFKEEIYAIGGYGIINNNIIILNSVEKFDQNSKSWTFVAPMLTEREDHAAVAVQNYIYSIGGADSNGIKLSSVECYDPESNKWYYADSMKYRRSSFAAIFANNHIYSFGGAWSSKKLRAYRVSSSIEVYDPDPDSCTWETLPPMTDHLSCRAAYL